MDSWELPSTCGQPFAQRARAFGLCLQLGHGGLELRLSDRELPSQVLGLGGGLRDIVLGPFEPLGSLGQLPLGGIQPLRSRILRTGDAFGQLELALGHLLPVLRLHARELGLELFAHRADLLLQLGFALDQVGSVRGTHALQLGLRRTKLVLEHRRSLFLGPQCPQLVAQIRQLLGAQL